MGWGSGYPPQSMSAFAPLLDKFPIFQCSTMLVQQQVFIQLKMVLSVHHYRLYRSVAGASSRGVCVFDIISLFV